MLVSDLIDISQTELISAKVDTYVREAAQTMAEFGVGLLVVLDSGGDLVGVISERDIIAAVGTSDTIIDYALVGDLMTDSVVTIPPSDSLIGAIQTMGSQHT